MRLLTLAKDWHLHRAGDRLHVLGPGEEHPGGELPAVDHARASTLVALGIGGYEDEAVLAAAVAEEAVSAPVAAEEGVQAAAAASPPAVDDWSSGDVIGAQPDGTVVLDDGLTTFHRVKADEFLRRKEGSAK